MPQYKEVISLKEACLDNIAENMTEFWCKYFTKTDECQEASNYEDGPFECLPGSLVDEIIETLKKKNLLDNSHLSLLITSRLEKLGINTSMADDPELYDLISFRCKDAMKKLTMHGHRTPPITLIAVLRKLEVLILSGGLVDDEFLTTLGSCCPELREFDLSNAYTVTDDNIQYLFMDNLPQNGDGDCASLATKDVVYGKCKLITSLNLQNTKVTASGLEAALRHLPKLQHLDHPELVSVLGKMHIADWEAGAPLPSYNLRSLFAGGDGCGFLSKDLDELFLRVAVDVCPFVTHVHFRLTRYKDCPDDILSALCKVKNLKYLDIRVEVYEGYGELPIPFTVLIPVLQRCGKTITYLCLCEVHCVDIGLIGIYCPILEDLQVSSDKSYADNSARYLSDSRGRPFSCLKFVDLDNTYYDIDTRELNLQNVIYTDIPPVHLRDIMSSPVLESLTVYKSSVLSDSLLRQVLCRGQRFSRLRKVEFGQCPRFTAEFIFALLHMSGPLTYIFMKDCYRVTRSDLVTFKTLVKRFNWDLHIEYHS